MLYGRPNAAYAIDYANALSSPNSWSFWVRVPMTGLSATPWAHATRRAGGFLSRVGIQG